MSQSLPLRPKDAIAWIVSPAWDLAYLVLTPVLIVPAVLLAARYWLTPEQIYLAVISFASLGHHLPGFMRAYGDRELFARYRWRFLLAPPLVFGLALLFTPPAAIRDAFGLPWQHLHGMELVLLVWGTWHGLMQTYGFMRIYDLRRGENNRTAARLDQALCLAMFTAGVVFSDTRMYGVAGAMWQSGLPLFGPEALATLRWIIGAACVAVALVYVVHLTNRRRQGLPINGVKLALAVVTGWFYWYCGRLSTNLLIGIAMFEIYHAVQYNAIVWIYNRRLFERSRESLGRFGILFGDRWTMLGLYLAAIGAYSSIRFFTAQSGDRMFSGDLDQAQQWLIAAFVTSSFLHFYYDGFIWKVSERKSRETLGGEAIAATAVNRLVPGAVHAGKWAALLAIIAFLVASERKSQASTDHEVQNEHMLQALAALTPEVPEARELSTQLSAAEAERQYEIGLELLKKGEAEAALAPLHEALRVDPTHLQAHLQLGDALLALGKFNAGADAYRAAITLRPDVPEARIGLADAYIKAGRLDAAEATLRDGLAKQPNSPALNFTLGLLLKQLGHHEEASAFLKKAESFGLSPRTD
jgi:tetratricopeptide (TPR) repeat protein